MLYTPIYDVRSRAFCGPTAIAAVTGEPVSVIRDVVRGLRGPRSNGTRRAIMGMSNTELLKVMTMLGWNLTERDPAYRTGVLRLGDFLDTRARNDGPFVVNVRNHYYAASHGEVCDTNLQIPIEIERFRNGRQRWVQRWWKFTRDDARA